MPKKPGDGNEVVYECDECGAEEVYSYSELMDGKPEREGWELILDAWHADNLVCADCAEDY